MKFYNFPKNDTIFNNLIKASSIINRPYYKNIVASISGGSDSDIVLDICFRSDDNNKIKYVWFDTGLEYQATKDHLTRIEELYGIKIERIKAEKPIPVSCKLYGQPFISKKVSDCIERLQKHNFKWEDKPFEILYSEYPKCKSALRWWCNKWGDNSQFNISYHRLLKEYMIENPPTFKISSKCCLYAKKNVAHKFIEENGCDLNIYGVRKSEGGARSSAYKTCFSSKEQYDEYRPIWFYNDDTKREYEKFYHIKHSDCYTKYGLKRTGCVGCPFGMHWEEELEIAKKFEPKLYNGCQAIFKDSYEYARGYYKYRKENK